MAVALIAGACDSAADVVFTDEDTVVERESGAAPLLGTSADDLPATEVTFVTDDERVTITARVAADPDSRQIGLMGVEELPDGVGMLFLMDGPVDHGFWMRDTLVPLDIAYVGADGRIVSIVQMEPCLEYDVAIEDCPSYPPGAVYERTVEVRQGWFAEVGVAVGDEVVVDDRA